MANNWVIDSKFSAAPRACNDKYGHAMNPDHRCECYCDLIHVATQDCEEAAREQLACDSCNAEAGEDCRPGCGGSW